MGNKILPGALEFIKYLKETKRDFIFLTNNSSCDARYYAHKLSYLGVNCSDKDILTSGEATAMYLKRKTTHIHLFVVGTPSLEEELKKQGFQLTSENPDCVIIGFDTTLNYEKLVTACKLIRHGIPFIATHPDLNCPTESGYIPDCGAITALITASTGVLPTVIGKPSQEIINMIFEKKQYPAQQIAIIGDRLYTDIAAGLNASIRTILVLSGETKKEDVQNSVLKPDYIFENLAALYKNLKTADIEGRTH